jgi:hypothetical protein
MRAYQCTSEKATTVPIYLDLDEIDFEGSGVLLTYGSRHFLGTAGHVIDNGHGKPPILGGCQRAISLDKSFIRNKPEAGLTAQFDPIDFAVTELTALEAQLLTERFRFVSLDPTTPYQPLTNRLRYQVMGFLAADNSADNRNDKLTANALRLQITKDHTPLIHDARRKAHKHWYVSGYYDPKKTHFEGCEQFKGLKDFHGFSGGAISHEEPFVPGVFREFAGITLECKTYKHGRFLFTGIGTRAIIDMLHKWYPDTPEPQKSTNPLAVFSI